MARIDGVRDTADRRLENVYWLGGGTGAGKSTIARRLAARYELNYYSTDDAMHEHAQRCRPEDCPCLSAFIHMDMDERWVNRSPEIMLETFHWFRGEGFHLIVEDLLELPAGNRTIVEGFRLLPDLVKPLLRQRHHGIWLLPSADFRLSALASRGSLWSIAARTSNPRRALDNLLERDSMFTERLRRDAALAGVPVVDVDASLSEDQLERTIAGLFGL